EDDSTWRFCFKTRSRLLVLHTWPGFPEGSVTHEMAGDCCLQIQFRFRRPARFPDTNASTTWNCFVARRYWNPYLAAMRFGWKGLLRREWRDWKDSGLWD